MNCHPGDLARVVSPGVVAVCDCGFSAAIVRPDTLVTVTTFEPSNNGWLLEKPLPMAFFCPTGRHWMVGNVRGIWDAVLRPIRDPGPNAVDQIVELVGAAPMTLTEILEGAPQ